MFEKKIATLHLDLSESYCESTSVFDFLGGDRVSISERRSYVDLLAEIVSISERRSCVDLVVEIAVDLRAALDSLTFSSNLKNLHRGGECRKRIKS